MRENVSGQAQQPVFRLVMRGYDRHEVDEYLLRLSEQPDLPRPKFALVMRGYDTEAVDLYLQALAHRPKS
jgi:DivIVA domain-containing protein